jgi:hypothetical protein
MTTTEDNALIKASEIGQREVVQLLLETGADIEAKDRVLYFLKN